MAFANTDVGSARFARADSEDSLPKAAPVLRNNATKHARHRLPTPVRRLRLMLPIVLFGSYCVISSDLLAPIQTAGLEGSGSRNDSTSSMSRHRAIPDNDCGP